MDIDLFLRTYAVNVMVGMWDDYWVNTNNFYFHFASDGKAYFIPYDYDNTLGTSQLLPNSGIQDPLNWGPGSGRPLVTKILSVPAWRDQYKAYITELASRQDLFAASGSMQRVSTWQALVSPYVSNDTGEDMSIGDTPAYWGNAPFYRLSSGNSGGGSSGEANYFSSRIASIPW
jgi:spore coat protein CotH